MDEKIPNSPSIHSDSHNNNQYLNTIMEKLNAYQIEEFLKIEREVTGSADHYEANFVGIWGGNGDTVSSMTITTSLRTAGA